MTHQERQWGLKDIESDFDIEDLKNSVVNKDLIPIIDQLISEGFEVVKESEYGAEYLFEFKRWQEWYGSYCSQVRVSIHRVRWIYESFSGAATGIEGWGKMSFSGSIENIGDYEVVTRCCGLSNRIKEWYDKRK